MEDKQFEEIKRMIINYTMYLGIFIFSLVVLLIVGIFRITYFITSDKSYLHSSIISAVICVVLYLFLIYIYCKNENLNKHGGK